MNLQKLFLFTFIIVGLTTQLIAFDIGKLGVAGLGFASGIYWHELGHATTGVLVGGHVREINFMDNYITYDKSVPTEDLKARHRWVCLGGYIAQSIASEIIIDTPSLHENNFALGWMTMGIFNNLNNVYAYYLRGNRNNDLAFYKDAGGDPLIPAILMTSYSIWSIYRICNTPAMSSEYTKMFGITISL